MLLPSFIVGVALMHLRRFHETFSLNFAYRHQFDHSQREYFSLCSLFRWLSQSLALSVEHRCISLVRRIVPHFDRVRRFVPVSPPNNLPTNPIFHHSEEDCLKIPVNVIGRKPFEMLEKSKVLNSDWSLKSYVFQN